MVKRSGPRRAFAASGSPVPIPLARAAWLPGALRPCQVKPGGSDTGEGGLTPGPLGDAYRYRGEMCSGALEPEPMVRSPNGITAILRISIRRLCRGEAVTRNTRVPGWCVTRNSRDSGRSIERAEILSQVFVLKSDPKNSLTISINLRRGWVVSGPENIATA
jgi:hypothetical protein